MYISRLVEPKIREMIRMFKVVLITGPRQVGKTTTLLHLFDGREYEYVTLDNQIDREIALRDPKAFFLNHPGKLIIDEIQYAPSLFQEIKYRVDREKAAGQYILTGSQTFPLMSGATESLAGRVGILQMSALSLREIVQDPYRQAFIPNKEYLQASRKVLSGPQLWKSIHRGSLPELSKNPELDNNAYYSSYVNTYLERDVRAITNVRDLRLFSQFIRVLAARVSQLLNYSEIASELGINNNTVKSWVSILEASGIVRLLSPFSNNRLTRVVKTPVLYFMDTGLVVYLLQWTTPETLSSGAMSGAILENFAVSEVVKSFFSAGITDPPITFYRDKDQKEIDLIVESSGILYPVEIKQTSTPTPKMAKQFRLLEKAQGFAMGQEVILSMVEQRSYLTEKLVAYPIGAV